MRIYLVTIVCLSLFLVSGSSVWAVAATPSATPTSEKTKQIEDLKERLATKVAELQQTQKRAITGVVKSTSLSTITVETKNKDVKIELTETITVAQVLARKRTKLTTDDIDEGDRVTVFGDFDATLDILKATVIFIQGETPSYLRGTVTAVSAKDFTITLVTAQQQSYSIDFEKTTKMSRWDPTKGLAKAGFSTVAVGDTIHVVGSKVPKQQNRISAARIANLGNITGAPTAIPTPEPTPKATPKPTPTPES